VGEARREHRWVGIEWHAPGLHVAVCACGWRSDRFSTAGLAGASWDRHEAATGDGGTGAEEEGSER
jgi:hypothetical protein